ncbi:DUF6480 family protein [Streptomyces sp. NPDC006173]|uniref:DUF6480 family protein n=1 Tax=Streptomyces sp. NPDC006173 TaxID=3155349 RepID=UPI0033FCCDB7
MLRNLPSVPPDFVGRGDELAHLAGALRDHRVVTLTGAGGVGKSRLALHAADRHLGGSGRGVAWTDLWPLQDDRLLVATVADAVDFSDHTTNMALDSLADWLSGKDVLLVLDSCEHLVGPCRRMVARLVLSCPRLTVLATSREPLGVPGEHLVAVDPLPPTTDAVEMFCRRAAAAGTPVSAPADMVTVARLCRRLEGMPLAVELIAGQLTQRTVAEVDLELGLRLDIAADTVLAGPPRHRAVRTTIGWSHELCTPAERLLWARMSVFRDGVDAHTARTVCAGGPLTAEDVDGALEGLSRKSVLTRVGVAHRMLDTVREYGTMWLEQLGESTELARRHADHFLALARESHDGWLGERQAHWYARLDAAHTDLCAALDHLLDDRPDTALDLIGLLGFPWSCCGHLREASAYLEDALALSDTSGPERTRALWALGVTRVLRGEHEPARRLAEFCQRRADLQEAFGARRPGSGAAAASRQFRPGVLRPGSLSERGPGIGPVRRGRRPGHSLGHGVRRRSEDAPSPVRADGGEMAHPLVPPGETPPAEGSIAEAHQERPDGGIWEHPYFWLGLIIIGSLVVAAFFVARISGL